jgi:hypothetical protein
MGRGICGSSGSETAGSGQPRRRRRKRPPLGHPELVEGPHIDQIADVARQFAEEKGGLRILHRHRLQGSEVVPQDGGPGVAAHGIFQPFDGHLLVTKAVGSQEELLQLLVRVADSGGVSRQRADGGNQRKQ